MQIAHVQHNLGTSSTSKGMANQSSAGTSFFTQLHEVLSSAVATTENTITIDAQDGDGVENELGNLSFLFQELSSLLGDLYMEEEAGKSELATELFNALPEDIRKELESHLAFGQSMELLLTDPEVSDFVKLVMSLVVVTHAPVDAMPQRQETITSTLSTIMQALLPEATTEQKNAGTQKQQPETTPKTLVERLLTMLTPVQEETGKLERLASNFQQTLQGVVSTKSVNEGVQVVPLGQSLDRVQQFVFHVGEQSTKHAQQQQFNQQLEQLLKNSSLRQVANGMSQLTIKLNPAHLGRLDITLMQQNGVITARVLASSTMAKDLIESQLHQLRQSFVQQQLTVERIEVVQQHSAGQLDKDEQNKQEQEQKQDEQTQGETTGTDSFSDILEELAINEQV
ncbi:flagellar hook-length control protein FliK [Bacillus alkalicellulosilyticus]|uniref:flagellar hook-length control protein FliK n=1 Tax=Alkalihalobacterium alkalicellulosilyticum TaxID=1912214 RepID=UPI00099655DF|nr:flagellar hook-length control protein FliK [Bacillus alkalicellulosilyticus]